eukprot:TRINITY_DN7178_c0_g1_i1.p1 TRINITY_DN7178_c0_g1~~TRINITY_DN7178_c0_g1_i1.p1  ORF type:complete len:117 (-),score=21.80 TRINITY_DN7178_c0_g1_i1:172-522(-)
MVLFGQAMAISYSKYQEITLGAANEFTKDYTHSREHRFRIAGSKNFKNICAPSATLHVSNIDEQLSEEELKTELDKHGIPVIKIQYFSNNRKMDTPNEWKRRIWLHNCLLLLTTHC